jgi:homoserine dehydrogenase
MKTIRAGLIGFGVIGSGVVRILEESRELIARRLGAELHLKKIADLDIETDRGVPVNREQLTTNVNDILEDPEIDIVIELIGGYEPARSFVLKALENGKHVVSANKALLSKHGDEIFASAEEKNLSVGIEASVAGAIPIIRSIREAFAANPITLIEGIVNGTANYILSRMSDGSCDFDSALLEAQEKGFAEADPTFDIEGMDSAHKIAILTSLAFGTSVDVDRILVEGISTIGLEDIQSAAELGFRIKLLAISSFDGESIDVRVHPAMLPNDHPMASINGVLNAVRICDPWMQENVLVGHGAGSLPTGSAVVGDVIEIARGILSGSSGRVAPRSFPQKFRRDIPLRDRDEITSAYFLRVKVKDQPGVLSTLSGILGSHAISIESVLQRERSAKGRGVPLMIMTHTAKERDMRQALQKISELECVDENPVLIRVEK